RALAVMLALIPAATGCTTTHLTAARPGTITVVATTTQMQDLVRNVGGDNVTMVGILRPNVDPHDFEPTPAPPLARRGASLVVESGVGLDRWADPLTAGSGSAIPTFVASDGLPLRAGDGSEPAGDPHWWHDPTLFERAATSLGERLAGVDPAHAAS